MKEKLQLTPDLVNYALPSFTGHLLLLETILVARFQTLN